MKFYLASKSELSKDQISALEKLICKILYLKEFKINSQQKKNKAGHDLWIHELFDIDDKFPSARQKNLSPYHWVVIHGIRAFFQGIPLGFYVEDGEQIESILAVGGIRPLDFIRGLITTYIREVKKDQGLNSRMKINLYSPTPIVDAVPPGSEPAVLTKPKKSRKQ